MPTFQELLTRHQLTFNEPLNPQTFRRLKDLTSYLDEQGVLTKELMQVILHSDYPRDERGLVLGRLENISAIPLQGLSSLTNLEYPMIDEFINALNKLEDGLEINPELFSWLLLIETDHTMLAETLINLYQLDFPEQWIKETLAREQKYTGSLKATSESLVGLQLNEKEAFEKLFTLFKNPLVLGAYNRSNNAFYLHYREDLQALLSDELSFDERVELAFNLFNRNYSTPAHQASFDSACLWGSQEWGGDLEEDESDEHAYDVKDDDEEQEAVIAAPSAHQVSQSRNYALSAVKDYFKNLPLETSADYLDFNERLQNVKKQDGVALIWDEIRYQVANSINWHKESRKYPDFHSLMIDTNAGRDVNLQALSLREQVQESRGYRAFCVQNLTDAKTRGQKRTALDALNDCDTAATLKAATL